MPIKASDSKKTMFKVAAYNVLRALNVNAATAYRWTLQ